MARRGSCRKLGHNKRTCQKSAEIGESSANSKTSENGSNYWSFTDERTCDWASCYKHTQERNVERALWNFNVNTTELHNTYAGPGPMKLAKTLLVRKSGYKTTIGEIMVKSALFSQENGANVITSIQLKESPAVAKAKIEKESNKNFPLKKEK